MKQFYFFLFFLIFSSLLFAQTYKKISIPTADKQTVTTLSQLGIALEGAINIKENQIDVFVSEDELQKINSAGIGYQVLIDDWKKYYESLPKLNEQEKQNIMQQSENDFSVSGFKFGSMGGYYTFAEIITDLDSMYLLYPNLITQKDSIGASHEGRAIWMVKVSDNPNVNEDEPTVGFDALIHAREPQSMATQMYFIWYLLENYGTDPLVTYLVDNREFYFIPCVNPDGYEYNRQTDPNGGGFWRKNRRNNGGSYGVDLNRNFGYMWGYDNNGSSPDPTSNTYRGPSPFSEPEATAVRDLAIMHNYGTHFNMHSHGDYYLYPWGYIDQQTPDSLTYQEFASDMGALSGYTFGTGPQLLGYNSNGSVRDWMYGEQNDKEKIFGYTIEIGPAFWPLESQIFPIAQQNVEANLYHAFVAGEFVDVIDAGFDREFFLPGDIVQLYPVLKNKGLATGYDLSVELSSSNGLVTVTNGTETVDSIEARSTSQIQNFLEFEISGAVELEDEIDLTFTVKTGANVMSTFTETIIIGKPEFVFMDTTNDPTQLWTITASPSNPKWEETNLTFFSPPNSYTDSKNGNYSNNATVRLILTDPVDLSNYTKPRLVFQTKFNIESNWDYGQVEVSTNNGSSWTPLEGEYTEPGVGSFQPNGQPVYDAILSSWSKEEISLENYNTNQVKIRFELRTDGGVTEDGWYLDDIGIYYLTLPITSNEDETQLPTEFSLEQNYPNPFNPSTKISWQSPVNSHQSLKIFDLLGNEVATLVDEYRPAGSYDIEFDAIQLTSGIYFYTLKAGSYTSTKKMILLK